MKKKIFLGILVCLITVTNVWSGGGQVEGRVWPASRVVEIVTGAAAASGADAVARVWMTYLKKTFPDVTFYVVNDPGGAATVAYEKVRNARSDGSQIGYDTMGPLVAYAADYYQYSLPDDFTIIGNFRLPQPQPGLAVTVDSKYKTFQDLIDDAKARPNMVINPAGQGAVLARIVGMEEDFGVTFRKVDAAGNGERIANLLGGIVDVISVAPASIDPYVESGQLRYLAIYGNERYKLQPDVPCTAELGYPMKATDTISDGILYGPKSMSTEMAEAIYEVYRGFCDDKESQDAMMRIERTVPQYLPRQEGIDLLLAIKKSYDANGAGMGTPKN